MRNAEVKLNEDQDKYGGMLDTKFEDVRQTWMILHGRNAFRCEVTLVNDVVLLCLAFLFIVRSQLITYIKAVQLVLEKYYPHQNAWISHPPYFLIWESIFKRIGTSMVGLLVGLFVAFFLSLFWFVLIICIKLLIIGFLICSQK